MVKAKNGVTKTEVEEIAKNLVLKGFVEVGEMSKLSPRQYQVSSYTGDASSFGEDIKYNIRWHE
jgi:hypothetical protein